MKLEIAEYNQLTDIEKRDIDNEIDKIINKNKQNSFEINKLVFESVTALEAGSAYTNELESQGMVKRFFGSITGRNKELQAKIDNNMYKAQYASQQTLQKLAEQNLMSFELITAVNNKLNSSVIEIENEINNVYGTMIAFFKQTKSDIVQLENRVSKLEKNVNLLNWINTIEYQMFNGVEYVDLNKIEKIICIASDFYEITGGDWASSDIMLIKSALGEIDLSPRDTISYMEFLQYIDKNKEALDKLGFNEILDIDIDDCVGASVINGFEKMKKLEGDEAYIVDSVSNILTDTGVNSDNEGIKYSLTEKYVANKELVDINKEVKLFDFILELIINISMFRYKLDKNNMDIDFENEDIEVVKLYAEKGNKKAQNELGDRFYKNEDYEQAYKWYIKAAEQEYAPAQCNIGYMYYNGDEYVDKDYEQAYKWYMKAVEQGDEHAKGKIGHMYYYGDYVSQDYEQAYKWYIKAAEQGDKNTQWCLGMNYYYGDEYVDKDYEQAYKWYIKAAEQGDGYSQCEIGNMYKNGEYVSQDYEQAYKWYMKAAEQGDGYSQCEIGNMYKNGNYVSQDYEQAYNWYIKAAEQGVKNAQTNIALMYHDGNYVSQDYEQAYKWYMKASEEFSVETTAMNNIGYMYQYGQYVSQDYEEARKWYKKAAELGNETAKENLDKL